MGRTMLFESAKRCNFSKEGYVYLWKYCGIASGGSEDKFSATKLTPVKSDIVDAPYIKEFPLILECKLKHTIEIGLHTQFIGEIMDVKVEESVLGEDGAIDVEKVLPFFYAPEIRAYYGVGKFLGKAFSIGKQFKGK